MAFWPKKTDGAASPIPAAAASVPPPTQPATTSNQTDKAAEGTMSKDDLKKMAEASKRLSASFGEVVALLMRTKGYAAMPLSDLEWLVVPALVTGQFSLAEAQSKTNGVIQPMAVVLWARVSNELHSRLLANPEQAARMKPAEWVSGENIWVVEAIGERRIVEALLTKMSDSVWSGKTVKVRVRNKEGKLVVGDLARTAPKANSATT